MFASHPILCSIMVVAFIVMVGSMEANMNSNFKKAIFGHRDLLS